MDGGSAPRVVQDAAECTPDELIDLADAYAEAAETLWKERKAGPGLARYPADFCALHAIDLYLHAFLRFRGAAQKAIRSRQHALFHEEFCLRLGLDRKTCDHLELIDRDRHYTAVRYRSETVGTVSPVNPMQQTLRNIREAHDKIPFSV